MLAIGAEGRGYWIDYSVRDPFLCPLSDLGGVLEGEILLTTGRKLFRMMEPFLGHQESFSRQSSRFECTQGGSMADVEDIFHHIIYQLLDLKEQGRIEIVTDRSNNDCNNNVVILSLITQDLLNKHPHHRHGRDLTNMVRNDISQYFEASNLRKLSHSLDTEELNLAKLFTNQIKLHSYWSKFSAYVDNQTITLGDGLRELQRNQDDSLQQANLNAFATQVKALSDIYFSKIGSGSFYNTNTLSFVSQALVSGAVTLYGGKNCQFVEGELLCHLSLPTYQYNSEDGTLSILFYGESVKFKKSRIYKCVPKFQNGLTSIRNHRVLINSDQNFNVVQTDDSHLYRRDSEEKYIPQQLVMSQSRCYFNGGPQEFIMSCESDSTVSGAGVNKFILEKFKSFRFNKTSFPLLINGVLLPLEKVLTQIIHSATMNVASDLYTGVSVTPSQFHTVIQNLGFNEDEPELDFEMIWNNVSGKSYVTITGVLLGLFTCVGLGWMLWRCIPLCKKYHKGYKLQSQLDEARVGRESLRDAASSMSAAGTAGQEPAVSMSVFGSTPTAPPEEVGSERIVKFSTRSTGTSVFPRDRKRTQ